MDLATATERCPFLSGIAREKDEKNETGAVVTTNSARDAFSRAMDELDFGPFKPPCKHNNWDNTRVKKNTVTLTCRECGTHWKLPHPIPVLCPEFHESHGICSLIASCPYLHVHRFKCKDRCPDPPATIAHAERDERIYEAARTIIAKAPKGTMPAAIINKAVEMAATATPLAKPTTEQILALAYGTVDNAAQSQPSTPISAAQPFPQRDGRLLPVTKRYVPVQRRLWKENGGSWTE